MSELADGGAKRQLLRPRTPRVLLVNASHFTSSEKPAGYVFVDCGEHGDHVIQASIDPDIQKVFVMCHTVPEISDPSVVIP